jgi:hypothetical protein
MQAVREAIEATLRANERAVAIPSRYFVGSNVIKKANSNIPIGIWTNKGWR